MATPEEMAAKMIASMPEKTGKSIEEWLVLTAPMKDQKHGIIVKSLKTDHGLTHGFASLIAHETLKNTSMHIADDDLVATQYAGPKAHLKPIYERLLAALNDAGMSYEISPKKAYVSLRASKQFAQVQPSTKTRLDLGLVLKEVAPVGVLEAAGNWSGMVSHRIRLEALEDVSDEVINWLVEAARQCGAAKN